MFDLSKSESDPALSKFKDGHIYFSGLHSIDKDQCSEDLRELLQDNIQPGSIVWNTDLDANKVFVKCVENSWVYFTEATLPGLGKLTVPKLIAKLLKKKKAKSASHPDGSQQFKFNFN